MVLTLVASACATATPRRLRERDATIARLTGELAAAQQRASALELDLESREHEIQAARRELEALRAGGQTGLPGGGRSDAERSEIALLRAELQRERQRRQDLEAELDRLRRETSSPFGEDTVPQADYLALKQELVDLRRSAQRDRQARDQLAAQLESLQRSGKIDPQAIDDPAQRAHVEALQREKDQIIASLNRNLAASQQRAQALEEQLSAARQSAGDSGTLREENNSLRGRLDEERRRTQELEAKLRVASRVTELIFRMQSQQGSAPAGRDRSTVP
jgi:septal ring factor EnvC (AmiA/AmiB activator)